MGKFLRRLRWSLLMATFAASAQAACQLQQLGELPVKFVGESPTVEAQINGVPARMMLDTGSNATLLLRDAAVRRGLSLHTLPNTKIYGSGGGDLAELTNVKELQVANLVSRDQNMIVASKHSSGFDGLLGADFLLQADVEFDFPDNKVRFFRPQNCKGDQVVYWGKAYSAAPMAEKADEIEVTVNLNGTPVRAMLDTSSGASFVTRAVAARTGVASGTQGVSAPGKLTGPKRQENSSAFFPSFSFGDETIRNATLRFEDIFTDDKETSTGTLVPAPAVDAPQMVLGVDFFRAHRVYVARDQKLVYISYVGGPVFAPLNEDQPPPPTAAPSPPK